MKNGAGPFLFPTLHPHKEILMSKFTAFVIAVVIVLVFFWFLGAFVNSLGL